MEDDRSVSGVREWDGLGSVIDSWTGYQWWLINSGVFINKTLSNESAYK
jgi:hypothetical protein